MPENEAAWQTRWRQRKRTRTVSEIDRICSLPISGKLTPEGLDKISKQNVQAGPYNGDCECITCRGEPFRLLPDQANGLHAFIKTGCGFFNIKVGGGKTGLCQLIASRYHEKYPDRKSLLLLPASVYSQFWLKDLPWARRHLAIAVPWFGLGASTQRKRLALARSGQPGCYVLPYSCLSTEDTIEVLREIDAKLVIADEAQNLRGQSAKTKRWWSFVKDASPIGVGMSGTLTTRNPMEYHALMRWCLGSNCPLPRPKVQAVQWANMLKSDADDPTPDELTEIMPLLRWASANHTTRGIRKAYKQRLITAPGFYRSGDKELGVALEIVNPVNTPQPNEKLKDMIREVETRWVHPNGDILSFGIELHAALRELSAGFYYNRFWDENHPLTPQAKAHFEAGQVYYKELQRFFGSTIKPREGLDTPLAVGKHHKNHGAITKQWTYLFELWKEWRALYQPDLPERLSEPVWVDDYKINHALAWAKDLHNRRNQGGIIWVIHRAVGDRMLQRLHEAGLPGLRKGSGDKWLRGDGSETSICVASIDAHGTGKNLQDFKHQTILQWPRSATQIEQLIGRTHRTGQHAERLLVNTIISTPWDQQQMACTIMDTIYTAETMGSRPKLQIADWNPLPPQFTAEILRDRGWAV